MKKTLPLTIISHGPFHDYHTTERIGFVCGKFVQFFLGKVNPSEQINFTYTDKNPKKKGFKKVEIKLNENHETDLSPYKVFVGGELYKQVSLFWKLEEQLDSRYDIHTFWVKIEEIK